MRIQTRKSEYFEQAGHLEPAEEECELDGEEEGVEEVELGAGAAHRQPVRRFVRLGALGVDPLTTDESRDEVGQWFQGQRVGLFESSSCC